MLPNRTPGTNQPANPNFSRFGDVIAAFGKQFTKAQHTTRFDATVAAAPENQTIQRSNPSLFRLRLPDRQPKTCKLRFAKLHSLINLSRSWFVLFYFCSLCPSSCGAFGPPVWCACGRVRDSYDFPFPFYFFLPFFSLWLLPACPE